MSVLISGVLADGAGLPMSGYHILLKARQNTSAVVMRTVATVVTGPTGEYAFEAQTGRYDIYLRSCIEREYCVGDIAVYDDSKPGTLNDFLTALDEGDLKPDVVKRFEELVAQAQQSAEAAAESERQAGQHAADAKKIKDDCQTLADNVQQNAEVVAASKQQVEQLASQVKDTAEEVRQDAEAAKQAASDAEQARDDIDVALSATLKTANHLSEIAAEGEDAQQESRDNLGLKSAAVRDVQAEIYDRTEGRLAIPGAFGFGSLFFGKDRITFKTSGEFSDWVRTAKPGRYVVYGADEVIPGVLFSGIVEIIWPGSLSSNYDPKYTGKIAIFYGVNGEIYYARGNSGPIGAWVKWKLDTSDLIAPLQSTTGNSWGSPDIGGLIFGAYFGESDTDNNRKMKRGQAVSGSRVGMVTISAKGSTTGGYASSAQFVTVSPNSYPQAGAFIALSGSHLTTLGSSECFVGLFMRVV
ncbi:prophage tail fiber N-terminal domain-containing protein [Escherichia coli]|nr:prophage tail fiber N-terminal domain-containing protein [Escherichia coli]